MQADTESHKILSSLSQLIKLFEKLPSGFVKILLDSAKHIETYFHTSTLVTELHRIVLKNETAEYAKYTAEILTKILEHSTPIPYPDEEWKYLVDFLYKQKMKEEADYLCNEYGRRGHDFLRQLYYDNKKVD